MIKLYSLVVFLIISLSVVGQEDEGFKFGQLDRTYISATAYEPDSAVKAFVIQEFGYAFISESENSPLTYKYQVKIKILKDDGVNHANVSIPLRKHSSNSFETIRNIKAISYNLENGGVITSELDPKKIYTEKMNNYYDVMKFAIPNAKAGSIIEYTYTIQSPFIFNFRKWEFQTTIPKIKSEFWARIPGNYNYNVALKGFYKLSNQNGSLIKDCFRIGGGVADCSLMKYEMVNIPAFIEEQYMTASENYISSMNFELMEIKHFNGSVNKITKTWTDIYNDLKADADFGGQIKKHSELFKRQIDPILSIEKDKKNIASKIFDIVKNKYEWNNYYGKYAELGLKKAYETGTGNTGDINLALIGALKYAKIDTEPVLVSTRNNGFPTKIFPVLSDFNYVIAKVNVNNESYLLDATSKDLPFGLLPYHCLNLDGRAIGKDSCYWVSLVPKQKFKKTDFIDLKLENDGSLVGTISKKYFDYDALNMRKKIRKFASLDEYVEDLDEKLTKIKILEAKISNLDSINNPLIEEFKVKIDAFDNLDAQNLTINPFILNQIRENPFKLAERIYPVDFGAPIEQVTILKLDIPDNFKLKFSPPPVALALPEKGGRYIYSVSEASPQSIQITEIININKTEFSYNHYPFLKELYNKIVQTNKSDLIIARK